mmetsp:Transcript_43134/g.73565  ORF Transcript_43134/g.73565 Transcript_43134/m.73565 type:complete len:150 (-) Transcript_43134:697-1146(-)
MKAIDSVLTEFHNHSEPIICTPKMQEFLIKTPEIFGGLWTLLCDLRGVKPARTREKAQTERKLHEVFFALLSMVRISNLKQIPHWVLIQNISNFSRGIGRTAECAFTFFGHTLAATSREWLFNRITGNDNVGRLTNNTLRKKATETTVM